MQELNILDFGADKNGITVSTKAIQKAIDQCPDGGRVYIPQGTYVSGALFLKSNMTFFIEQDAVIKGSGNTDDFPIKTYRWEGRETEWRCMGSYNRR